MLAINFVINCFFMKLFKTNNLDVHGQNLSTVLQFRDAKHSLHKTFCIFGK